MIKKSFTMIEMIFVILIVAVLAIFVTPKFCGDACGKSADLIKAANQVLGHIRYTRHLAMVDNKFVPNTDLSSYADTTTKTNDSRYWFNKRWQIVFHRRLDTNYNYIYYSIFSDIPWNTDDNFDGSPNNPVASESHNNIAKDPLTGKYLTGHHWSHQLDDYLSKLNLKETYSIDSVNGQSIKDECLLGGSSNVRILFDNIGRPYCKEEKDVDNGYLHLIRNKVSLELKQDNQCIYIYIEPETGYSYIDYEKDCS